MFGYVKKMRLSLFVFTCFLLTQNAFAQFVFPKTIARNHPRLISAKVSKDAIRQKLEASQEVRESYESKIAKYVI